MCSGYARRAFPADYCCICFACSCFVFFFGFCLLCYLVSLVSRFFFSFFCFLAFWSGRRSFVLEFGLGLVSRPASLCFILFYTPTILYTHDHTQGRLSLTVAPSADVTSWSPPADRRCNIGISSRQHSGTSPACPAVCIARNQENGKRRSKLRVNGEIPRQRDSILDPPSRQFILFHTRNWLPSHHRHSRQTGGSKAGCRQSAPVIHLLPDLLFFRCWHIVRLSIRVVGSLYIQSCYLQLISGIPLPSSLFCHCQSLGPGQCPG